MLSVEYYFKGGVGTQATPAMAGPLFNHFIYIYISENIRFIIYQKHFSSVNWLQIAPGESP